MYYIESQFGVPAGNAGRDGTRLFRLIESKVRSESKVQGPKSRVAA
jgi:hypothetical protein